MNVENPFLFFSYTVGCFYLRKFLMDTILHVFLLYDSLTEAHMCAKDLHACEFYFVTWKQFLELQCIHCSPLLLTLFLLNWQYKGFNTALYYIEAIESAGWFTELFWKFLPTKTGFYTRVCLYLHFVAMLVYIRRWGVCLIHRW